MTHPNSVLLASVRTAIAHALEARAGSFAAETSHRPANRSPNTRARCAARWLTGAAVTAAILLEESRIEAAHLARRPGDRHWLRACIHTLILSDFRDGAMTPWDTAQAAGLLLARVDTGILDEDEVTAVASTVVDILGAERIGRLRAVWRAAHGTGDHDEAGMLQLGRRWCEILGVEPEQRAPARGAGEAGKPSPLAEAVTAAVEAVASAEEPPRPRRADKHTGPTEERAAERAAREGAERIAGEVFSRDRGWTTPEAAPVHSLREPSPAEQAAARRLARVLRAAAHCERVATTSTSPTPPGRLRMREVLAADAPPEPCPPLSRSRGPPAAR